MTQQNIEQPLKATLVPKKGGTDEVKQTTELKKGSKNVDEKASNTSKD